MLETLTFKICGGINLQKACAYWCYGMKGCSFADEENDQLEGGNGQT